MIMKKLLTLKIILLLPLLLLFTGCESESITESTNNEYNNVVEQVPIVEDEDVEDESPYEVKAVRDLYASFTSTWARTAEHFFFAYTRFSAEFPHGNFILYRLPFDDIEQGEQIVVPGEGEIEIIGLDEQYLFIARRADEAGDGGLRYFEVYRISLSTLEAALIDDGVYYGVPFFHPIRNSIIFAHSVFDESSVWLEYLQLDTGIRGTIYRFESDNFFTFETGWWQVENDAVVFINSSWGGVDAHSDFILIDSEMQAQRIELDNIDIGIALPSLPQNPAGEFISGLEVRTWSPVTIDNRVYYLLGGDGWGWHGNLYRINIDGTQNTLLQDDIDFSELFSVNNTLLATIFPRPHQVNSSVWYEAVVLAEDGSIEKVLGGGWHGHNSAFSVQHLMGTDMVMVKQLNFFTVDGWVLALYCTNTGALFSLDTP